MHLHARNPALKLVMVPRNDLSSLPVNLNDQYSQTFTKITLDIPLLGSVLASPQTSFGVRLSRILDLFTSKYIMQNVGVVVAFPYLYFIFFLPLYLSQKQRETHLHPLYWHANIGSRLFERITGYHFTKKCFP